MGFYSTFVVADKVEVACWKCCFPVSLILRSRLKQVYTKTADKEKGEIGYLWTSDGWDTKCKCWNFQCLIKNV